jgi:myb proto-oncogene protein
MVRFPCCTKEGLNRGAWSAVEDMILFEYIRIHGDGRWRKLPQKAGESEQICYIVY